jgi:glycosyltransferase involved in cell wall biosynthesis
MKVSVVIPVYNEKEVIDELVDSLLAVMGNQTYQWEVVFVDDGSQDESFQLLKEAVRNRTGDITLLKLKRNFGQTTAIAAGIDHAAGDIIVLMDADLQNDPVDIPILVSEIQQGFDVVSGWRHNRKDKYLTRVLPSRIANWLISWVTGVHLHDYGCTLKAYRKDVLSNFRLYGEMHRFIPAYASSVGARITEVKVKHHPRKSGKTKYGLDRTFKVILDLFTVKFLLAYSQKPLYLFGGLGLFLLMGGFGILLFLFIRRIGFGISPFDSPLFPSSILIILMAFQSLLMGLIAELLVRTYHEAQNKTTYTIQEIVKDRQ